MSQLNYGAILTPGRERVRRRRRLRWAWPVYVLLVIVVAAVVFGALAAVAT